LKKTHVQIVHADPRRLLVRLAHPLLQCHFLVLHAPQSGRPLTERTSWWQDTTTLAQEHCLIDANAKSGPTAPPVVFESDDVCSANTGLFLSFLHFLQACNLYLPSTSSVHTGQQPTWTTPDGCHQHRIDFIALPQTWCSCCEHSCVLPAFDAGNAHEDHQAVAVQLSWHEIHQIPPCQSVATKFCRQAIGRNKRCLDLQQIRIADWNSDIETQVLELKAQLIRALNKNCKSPPSEPKKQCLSGKVWTLCTDKLALRKRLATMRKQKCIITMRLFLQLWKLPDCDLTKLDQHDAYVATISCTELKLNCMYRHKAHQLRAALRKTKLHALNQELQSLSDNVAASDILHCIKPFLGPTNPKKVKRACLPLVKRTSGQLCVSPHEAQDRWIEFFQQMEGGRRITHSEYRSHWRGHLRSFLEMPDLRVPIHELPTLVDLEAAFRRVAIGKAIGRDGIPPELCRYKAKDLAHHTYAILLKTCLYGQEAIEHKGGRLAIAWKHKGDPAECSSHRSLLVSSHLGKTTHRALRQKHHGLYTSYMQAQQLGGRPRMPVGIPLHMTRAFMRWQHRLKCPTSVIFLDLTEAFYRVVRVLAVGGDLDDAHVAYIAAHLGFHEDTIHEFYQQLQEPSALHATGAPAHVCRFMQALHTDTWFTIGDQHDLVKTEQGSRPGDSYADVVFGLLWAKMLHKYEDKLLVLMFSLMCQNRKCQFYLQSPLLGFHIFLCLDRHGWMISVCVCVQTPILLLLQQLGLP